MRDEQLDAGQKLAWNRTRAQPEKVLDLRGGDEDGNAIGKSDDHHARYESHRSAKAGEAHRQQQNARHQRDHGQPTHAEAEHNSGHNHDERTGGPANLGA